MPAFTTVSNGTTIQASDVNQFVTLWNNTFKWRGRVHMEKTQTFLPNNSAMNQSYQKVILDSVNIGYDPAAMFDPVNAGFLIPYTGYWLVMGRMLSTAGDMKAGARQVSAIIPGGSQVVCYGSEVNPAIGYWDASVFSDVVALTVGDLLVLTVETNSTMFTVSGANDIFLSLAFMGPPG